MPARMPPERAVSEGGTSVAISAAQGARSPGRPRARHLVTLGVALTRKTGCPLTGVKIPMPREAIDARDAGPKRAVAILTNAEGQPWKSSSFRTAWQCAKLMAGIEGLTFNDLRGTAVTRLAIAGCEIPAIAAITGHSLKNVSSILDAHYLSRDSSLAETAIPKRIRHGAGQKIPN